MLEFAKSQPWTLGVEVELQIVDRSTHELTAKAPQILSRWSGPATVQPEIFQSMLEISTGICADAAAADCRKSRRPMSVIGAPSKNRP